jgi:hypothetical protein
MQHWISPSLQQTRWVNIFRAMSIKNNVCVWPYSSDRSVVKKANWNSKWNHFFLSFFPFAISFTSPPYFLTDNCFSEIVYSVSSSSPSRNNFLHWTSIFVVRENYFFSWKTRENDVIQLHIQSRTAYDYVPTSTPPRLLRFLLFQITGTRGK